ncbi:transporter substrate-binding domain-containing protein [Legionella sp. MW5194]|uniref:transporter substrate-binding domain-containing protein n=1 Tax=Legionella sp. MW5194 TaxID=2662448 RepID=UPI00193D10B5|nr:transporter substrate-binding domain-containing protein [Legionella sp. MW5194]
MIARLLLALLLLLALPVHSAGPPLVVAVDNFSPPFVLRGANSQLYGFDIAMMENICQRINRTCQYKPMPFNRLLDAVESGQAEAAVGSIIITSERLTQVNFSIPYLISESRFLGRTELAKEPFQLALFKNRKIGVEEGTVFPDVLASLISNPQIALYDNLDDVIVALHDGDIELALMDAPTALYWQSQSSGTLTALGKPFAYGFGLGVAVNRNNAVLLNEINRAITDYAASEAFKSNYQKYMGFF